MTRLVYVAAGLVLLGGCTPTEPSAAEALQAGITKWESRGPTTYDIIVHRGPCECLPAMLVPIQVSVRDQAIESVRHQETGDAIEAPPFHAMTVEEMFALIQSALTRNAHRAAVRYDPVLGYPRAILIDDHPDAIDDEIILAIELIR